MCISNMASVFEEQSKELDPLKNEGHKPLWLGNNHWFLCKSNKCSLLVSPLFSLNDT